MPLDPVIRQMFAKMAEAGRPALSAGSPEDARALMAAGRAALGSGPEMFQVTDLEVKTRSGRLAARLYRPSEQVEGLTVYLHGGGWVIGALDDFDAVARTLASRSGCALLLPDYRLAPEHPFPKGLEDSEDTVRWANENIVQLVGARVPLLIAGDSAGANLATVATNTQHARIALAGQLLIYPVTDSDFDRESYRLYSQGMQLRRDDMRWFFKHYAPVGLWADKRLSPLQGPVPPSLPPTVIFTAEYDVLRDEGEAYAAYLSDAGIDVAIHRVDSLPHGFIRLHNVAESADLAMTRIAAELKRLAKAGGRDQAGENE